MLVRENPQWRQHRPVAITSSAVAIAWLRVDALLHTANFMPVAVQQVQMLLAVITHTALSLRLCDCRQAA